jgi:hypothetical protein
MISKIEFYTYKEKISATFMLVSSSIPKASRNQWMFFFTYKDIKVTKLYRVFQNELYNFESSYKFIHELSY